MKKYFNISLMFFALLLLIYIVSCSEDSPTENPEKQVEFSSYQISGCNNGGLSKVNANDSCFIYSFNDTLKVDFCIWGNCCPNSQRFVTDYKINSDTIFITVQDTAMNECDCNCNYTIHVEFSELLEDKYLFYFNYPGMYQDDSLKYKELVVKN